MSEKEEVIKGQLKELVRGSVEETLNELLEQEAEKLTQAARYERSEARQGYRSGHYDRNLTTTSTLHVPRLKGGFPSPVPAKSELSGIRKSRGRLDGTDGLYPQCPRFSWAYPGSLHSGNNRCGRRRRSRT